MISQSIVDYSGVDDGITLNDEPLNAAIATIGLGGTIKLTRTASGVGIYLFSDSILTELESAVLDVDIGVTISFPTDKVLYNLKIRVTRDTKVYCTNLNDTYTLSSHRGKDWSAKSLFISAGDLDHSNVIPIQAISESASYVIAWPDSDTFTVTPPAGIMGNTVTLTPAYNQNRYLTMVAVSAGDEIAVSFSDIMNSSQLIHAMVRTISGYYGLDCLLSPSSLPSLFIK